MTTTVEAVWIPGNRIIPHKTSNNLLRKYVSSDSILAILSFISSMSFMKNLLPTTLPPQLDQYHQATTTALSAVRQSENLLVAIDLITHPWDDIFLRSSLRTMSRSLWEEVMFTWSYTRELSGMINDIHRGTATTIQFNALKYMTTVQNIVTNIRAISESCMSFITVSHQLRYMSTMNMNILHREIARLDEYVTNWQTHLRTLSVQHGTYLQNVSQTLQHHQNDTTALLHTLHDSEQGQRQKYDTNIEHVFSKKQITSISDIEKTEQKHNVVYESPREYQDTTSKHIAEKKSYLEAIPHDHENAHERKGQIVSMVRNRGVVSINDIAEHFPTLSRKTLQRDLSELIDQGNIIRTGDKRWATYRV